MAQQLSRFSFYCSEYGLELPTVHFPGVLIPHPRSHLWWPEPLSGCPGSVKLGAVSGAWPPLPPHVTAFPLQVPSPELAPLSIDPYYLWGFFPCSSIAPLKTVLFAGVFLVTPEFGASLMRAGLCSDISGRVAGGMRPSHVAFSDCDSRQALISKLLDDLVLHCFHCAASPWVALF